MSHVAHMWRGSSVPDGKLALRQLHIVSVRVKNQRAESSIYPSGHYTILVTLEHKRRPNSDWECQGVFHKGSQVNFKSSIFRYLHNYRRPSHNRPLHHQRHHDLHHPQDNYSPYPEREESEKGLRDKQKLRMFPFALHISFLYASFNSHDVKYLKV